ncbi:hypothetical protein Lade_2009 [Legionella adelaidensis]|uniref:Uncharacterized protein n=1 Tax=Legionella adelaidensis TaxID=45056 RepID=A0A0W0R169_9GAMM|nr:hypothetical protein [Legionella adelaidensis]KTC64715.1 hypothetical protein Lade_2009 [Legionella adelaidensis]
MAKSDDRKSQGLREHTEERQDKFTDLPDEILEIIAGKIPLDREDLTLEDVKNFSKFSRTNKTTYGLFKTEADKLALRVTKLLEHIVHGKQDEAEELIKKYPKLLTFRGDITDYSGRTFKNITPFEYTLWALDRHMWDMMLAALPDNETGQDIKLSLLQQYKTHREGRGVHYILNGQSRQERHYDFSLIDKLKKYVENCNHFRWFPGEQEAYWREEVHGAQMMLPVHVVNEYCYPTRSFSPRPSFNEKKLPRLIEIRTIPSKGDPIPWYSLNGAPIFRSGIVRSWLGGSIQFEELPNPGLCKADLVALTALREVRYADVNKLGLRLEIASTPDPASHKIPIGCLG